MSHPARKHFAAWLLLAVLVPAYIMASLHVHNDMQGVRAALCNECVQHHCNGHLVAFDGPTLTCVLCQFLSLTFVAAALGVAAFRNKVFRLTADRQQRATHADTDGLPPLRAPPVA